LDDINSLIDLIDNCVQEANDYIKDLTGRVEMLQEECGELRRMNRKQDDQLKLQFIVIRDKDEII
jgi:hypothetical protein